MSGQIGNSMVQLPRKSAIIDACPVGVEAHLMVWPDRLDRRWPVKRRLALLGSNPSRNSRSETHSDGTGSRSEAARTRNFRPGLTIPLVQRLKRSDLVSRPIGGGPRCSRPELQALPRPTDARLPRWQPATSSAMIAINRMSRPGLARPLVNSPNCQR
jgi:hypothetical protein